MPTPRFGHRAAVVGGKIYIISGATINGDIHDVDVYDPSTDTWAVAAPIPTARHEFGVAVVGNDIFVAGGYGEGFLSSFEKLDTTTNTWAVLPPMPVAACILPGAGVQGKAYFFGGWPPYRNTVYHYSPTTGQWGSGNPMASPISDQTVAVVGNRCLMAGGDANGVYTSACRWYDPITDSWSNAPSLCEVTGRHASAASNGYCLVVGGLNPALQPKASAFLLAADDTSPTPPEVSDDGLEAPSNSELHSTWTSSDPESGIAEYRYAIGTTPTDPGSGYIVGWKSAGTAAEATEEGLSLSPGQTYYWYVKAKNNVGLWSDVGASDGVTVIPQQPPSIEVGPPALVSCAGWSGEKTVSLSAEVADVNGDSLTLEWELDGEVQQTDTIAGGQPPTQATRTFTFVLTPGTHWLLATVSDGSDSSTKVVTRLDPALPCQSAINGGSFHSAVVAPDGTVWTWGCNTLGQLGNGGFSSEPEGIPVPAQVPGLHGFAAVAAGWGHTIALSNDGSVWAWGDNQFGELGNGSFTTSGNNGVAVPAQVPGLSGIIAVAGGAYHTLALRNDGTVWSWGHNWTGSLGIGVYTYGPNYGIATPVQVQGVSNVVAIAADGYHSMALRADGTVWEWGTHSPGVTASPTPGEVGGLADIVAIADGSGHSLALRKDGKVWAWPYNYRGQLGDGSFVDSATPVMVADLPPAAAVSAGYSHSLALTQDGVAYGWGDNFSGQVGNGTRTEVEPYGIPLAVPVLGGADIVGITAGQYFSLALKNDGSVIGWGHNLFGQLGNGTFDDPQGVGIPTTAVALPKLSCAGSRPAVAVADEGDVTSSSAQLSAQWDVTGSPEDVAEYRYSISTSPTDPSTGVMVPWTATTESAASASGLSLELGQTYYWHVQARTNDCVLSAIAHSDGIVVTDATLPSQPAVTDGGSITSSTDQLHASWESIDIESSIAEYQYAIGTIPTDPGSGYVVGWKSAGTAIESTESGLSLTGGQTYYWYVKAKNSAGLWSVVGVSDGILVEGTPPTTPVVTDDGVLTGDSTQLHVSWTATDPETGVADYQYAIGTTPADPGSGYIVGWKSAGTATEATETGLGLQGGQTYYWYVKAKNGAGLWSEVGASDGILVEGTPPTAPVVSDDGVLTGDATQLHAFWTANDPETGVVECQYAIGTTPTDPGSGYVVDWKSAGTATEATETGLALTYGQKYFWYVKAKNGAGLWSSVGASDGIVIYKPLLNPANGHYYEVVPGAFGWTAARDAAAARIYNGLPGHLSAITGAAEMSWITSNIAYLNSANATNFWLGACQDKNVFGFTEPNGGWKWVTGEAWSFTAWGANQPDNVWYTSLPGKPTEDFLEWSAVQNAWNDLIESGGIPQYRSAQGYLVEYEDFTPPTTPVVTDDGQFQTAGSSLHATWSASDAQSGIAEFQYAIGTTPADPGSGYLAGWKSAGTALEATESGLALEDGQTYYWYVRARNGMGLWSPVGASDGIKVDTTPPSVSIVTDDGSHTTSLSQLHASWASSDAHTGVAGYQYAIGTSPVDTGSGYLVSWKSAGTATEATETGLTLANGQVYYWYVKAKSGVGLWSAAGVSDGIKVGLPVLNPANEHYYEVLPGNLTWTEANALAESRMYDGQQGYLASITSLDEQRWVYDQMTLLNPLGLDELWVGGYQDRLAPDYIEPAGGWRWTSGEPWQFTWWHPSGEPNEYMQVHEDFLMLHTERSCYWYDLQLDGAGYIDGFMVEYSNPDSTPPTTPVVTDEGAYTASQTALSASWSSSDPESDITGYEYAIGTSPTDPGSGYLVGWKNAGTATQATETNLSLQPGQICYWYVRATNEAGLTSDAGASNGITVAQKLYVSPGEAKLQRDGIVLGLQGVVATSATGQIAGRVYVERPDGSSGIAVSTASGEVATGDVVDVAGTMSTTADGERIVNNAIISKRGQQTSITAWLLTLKPAAGEGFAYNAQTGAGQRGITDPLGHGLSSTGLLVRVVGWVADIDSNFAYINDGSWPQIAGVRVARQYLPADTQVNDFLQVTGISSIRKAGLAYQLLIRPRQTSDIILLTRQPDRTRLFPKAEKE